jgi:isoquinoline 1-oxidoreductase
MKSNEINNIYFGDVDSENLFNSNRRDFIKKLGSGLIIAFTIGKYDAFSMNEKAENNNNPIDFNAYLRIREDGLVECYTGKIEMGQGITTSLAQVIAEELEIPIERINMIMGDTDLCPYDAGTWGSLTTRFFDPVLRAAAVDARSELIKLASIEMQVSEYELFISEGNVAKISDTSIKISYAELTKGKKIVKTISSPPIYKKPSEYKKVGKPINATNAILKVTGKAIYAGDIKLPGMLYASICRPPAHDSKLVSVNTADAEKISSVKIIIIENLIAALHNNPETALIAQQKIKAEWTKTAIDVNDKTIFKYLVQNAVETSVTEEKGNLTDGFNQADFIEELDYLDGYKSHAPMETHTATVKFEDDKVLVWASTQTPFGARQELARKLDMPTEKVHIKQVLVGGGFGGKIYGNQILEAALIARKAQVPVQLAWRREEEFTYNMFRPAAVMQIKAGVRKNGKIVAWKYQIYCAGNRGVKDFYGIDNVRTALYDKKNIHPFGVGAWRAPGNNSTTFARESHIDVLANKIGMDPLEFRLKNISDPKMERTLRLAATTFGYQTAKTGVNKGCGIALGVDAGTYVAIIAEVSVDKKGVVTPLRMVCAQDMGQVVNPHGATVQTVGGLTMGLGYALYEDIEFNGGEIKTTNFHQYEITRFSVTPAIEAVFVDDMESPPQGGGEPAIICVGGAIANAVFYASGARVNQMPITPERVLNALKKA